MTSLFVFIAWTISFMGVSHVTQKKSEIEIKENEIFKNADDKKYYCGRLKKILLALEHEKITKKKRNELTEELIIMETFFPKQMNYCFEEYKKTNKKY